MERSAKAESPMLVTGRPLIELGMVIVSSKPVYAVMVIVPALVVKAKSCARVVRDNADRSRSEGSSLAAHEVIEGVFIKTWSDRSSKSKGQFHQVHS